jgi:DNA-binding MarR family transcriptional regulator
MSPTDDLARELRFSLGLLLRRLRQVTRDGDLTLPETSVLARLDRGGPASAADLARAEQISQQSMGATVGGLLERGLIERKPDPQDGRRFALALTKAGRKGLTNRREERTQALARGLATDFTDDELDLLRQATPLLERLADRI